MASKRIQAESGDMARTLHELRRGMCKEAPKDIEQKKILDAQIIEQIIHESATLNDMLTEQFDLLPDDVTECPRPQFGPVITRFKRLTLKFIKPLIGIALNAQFKYNAHIAEQFRLYRKLSLHLLRSNQALQRDIEGLRMDLFKLQESKKESKEPV